MSTITLLVVLFTLPNFYFSAELSPFFNPDTDLTFLLFTRINPIEPQIIQHTNIESIRSSNYNKSKELRVILHGFADDGLGGLVRTTTNSFLKNNDFNIIAVDWSRAGSQTIHYLAAVRRVPGIGRVIANFLDMLHANGEVDFANIGMVGLSLGAHIIGFTGKQVQRGKIDTLIGLDPTGPLFSVENPDGRLDSGDARYVEVINTNIGFYGLRGLIGTVNIFVNGGVSQPGCSVIVCSHTRSTSIFVESLNSDRLVARECDSLDEAMNSKCTGGPPGIVMGGEPSNSRRNVTGIYHLATNRNSPFGMGPLIVSN